MTCSRAAPGSNLLQSVSQNRRACCHGSLSMRAFQILIDGFAISALYALGATGFTLIFGVSGVLNLSHGAIMVAAAVAAWAAASVLHMDPYSGALVGVARGAHHIVCDLLRCRQADPEFAADTERGEGNLRPHRHAAVGDHDPGADRIFLHQQCQDGAADRRRRGRYPRRPHAAERNLHRGRMLSRHRIALAVGEPDADRQGRVGGLDEPARCHAARTSS